MSKKIIVLSNLKDPHIDFVYEVLHKYSTFEWVRIQPDEFPYQGTLSIKLPEPSHGVINIAGIEITTQDIKAIWYRRPLQHTFNPEISNSQYRKFALDESTVAWNGWWDLIPEKTLWVNHPEKIELARNKIRQLKRARDFLFNVPDSLITNDPKKFIEFYNYYQGNIIIKALKVPYLEENDLITQVVLTHKVNPDHLKKETLDYVREAPIFLQKEIEKQFELRVTVFGDEVFTAAIYSSEGSNQAKVDWRNDGSNLPTKPYALPRMMQELCRDYVHSFGLKFGAIDLIVTPKGDFVFLELNPNGQWGWVEKLTGLPLRESLIQLLER